VGQQRERRLGRRRQRHDPALPLIDRALVSPPPTRHERAPTPTLVTIFTGSLAILALEIAQVRVFSYAIDPQLVFGAISVALLGLGAGGIVVALFPQLARGDVRNRLGATLLAFAVSSIVAHAVFAHTSDRISFERTAAIVSTALPVLLALVVPYLFGGMFLAIALTRYADDVGRSYFANLVGSAIGGAIVAPLLRPIGAEAIVVGASAVAAGSAVIVASTRRARAAGIVIALVCLVATVFAPRWLAFRPDPGDLYGMARTALARAYPGRAASEYEPHREFAQWDPVSRVEIYAFPGSFGLINDSAPMRLFVQDGGAGSLLVDVRHSDGVRRALFEGSIWAASYFVREHPRNVLLVGLGGAPDVMTALYHGAERITGVEVNGSAIDLVRTRYRDFLGDPYGQPSVHIEHRDGRGFIERTADHYDLVQMTGADTYSAAAAGAFMFSESYLYTQNAFERYLRVLSADGILSITRFGPESARVITTAIAAMRALGIPHPARHLVLVRQGIAINTIYSARELTAADGQRIAAAVQRARTTEPIRIPVYEAMGFGVADPIRLLYAPGIPADGVEGAIVLASEAGFADRLLARSPFDLSPVSDDRPFFFEFIPRSQFFAAIRDPRNNFYARGLSAHARFLATVALIAFALLVLPIAIARRRGVGLAAIPMLAYFSALGLAYLFVEITLMQKTALFLGHPTISIATTIVSLLVGSGLGSAFAGQSRLGHRTLARRGAIASALLVVLVHVAFPVVFRVTLPLPLFARVIVAATLVAPLGFAMGIPFPMGIRIASTRGETLVAWGLATNSFASVIASLVAVPIAMFGGFPAVFAIAAGLYLAAAVVVHEPRSGP
jgi:hypothetical protein